MTAYRWPKEKVPQNTNWWNPNPHRHHVLTCTTQRSCSPSWKFRPEGHERNRMMNANWKFLFIAFCAWVKHIIYRIYIYILRILKGICRNTKENTHLESNMVCSNVHIMCIWLWKWVISPLNSHVRQSHIHTFRFGDHQPSVQSAVHSPASSRLASPSPQSSTWQVTKWPFGRSISMGNSYTVIIYIIYIYLYYHIILIQYIISL